MVKRGIMGTFHKVTPKYLPLYVNEFQHSVTTIARTRTYSAQR